MIPIDKLPIVTNAVDINGLKNLQQRVACNMNSLTTLGHPPAMYGTLLGSKIVHTLPREMQLEWKKDLTNKITDLKRVLDFLGEKSDGKERYVQLTGKQKQN